jgi:C1A family cysteine protease
MRSGLNWRSVTIYFTVALCLLAIVLASLIGSVAIRAAGPSTGESEFRLANPQGTPPPPPFEPGPGERAYGYVDPGFDLSHLSPDTGLSPDAAPLAERFDWRTQGKVTRVQDQSNCGSCYAFATLGSLESQLLVRNQPRYDFSENNVVECHYEALAKGRNGCDGGNIWLVTNHLSTLGTVLETCDPYSPANQPCKAGCPYIKTVTEMWGLYGTNPPVNSLKNWLRQYGPLYVTINAGQNDAWGSEFSRYNGSYTLYHANQDPNKLNHAVLLVGWDDSLRHAGGQGAWIVKNSWGTSWGGTCGYGTERGFFTIAYGSAGIGSVPAVIRSWQDYNSQGKLLYWDEDGAKSWIGNGQSSSAYGLVRLTPSSNGCATQVEFWTGDRTTDVDVYIYDSFDGNQPSGLLWKRENLAYEFPGYHSVPINPPLRLTARNDVAVMVKFGNQSYAYPIPCDNVGPAGANRSFGSITGQAGAWADLGAGGGSLPAMDVGIRLRMAPCAGPATATLTKTSTRKPATATPTKTSTRKPATATLTKTSTRKPATATPTRTRTLGPSPTMGRNRAYLPLLLKPMPLPGAPVLSAISNPDGDGNYVVNWGSASRAQTYQLQEDDNSSFSSPTVRYSGSNTSYSVTGQSAGTWYYRVQGCHSGGCGAWSGTQSVSVGSCPYSDDFSNPSSGWPTADDPAYKLEYVGGEYRILMKNTNWWSGGTSGYECTDGSIEVDGRFASSVYGSYGILFGITPSWDTYLFQVSGTQSYSLMKLRGGSWQTLVIWTFSSSINAGQARNHLGVVRNGSQISLYANGHSLTTVTDSSFMGKLRVGLAATAYTLPNVDARFDNFRVCPVGASAEAMGWAADGLQCVWSEEARYPAP